MVRKTKAEGAHGVAVTSTRHQNSRVNIPTEELRDFIADEEKAPKTMLYPRDPSLDPQLVWKGKDEQDKEALAVPVVPIYIQEKIHPQAIIDSLPRRDRPGGEQLSLFADFNGLGDDFDKKVDFYHHEQHWANRMILGDSLLVMTSLAEKEGLRGKVQTIYFDPPYGIKFGSNWQVTTRKRDVKDGKAEDATRQPEQIRAFRDTWKLGIHSYLGYLRDRLTVARELLTETGSIFVQIGDENVHLVRSIMDEVFGSENFIVTIIVKKKGGTKLTEPVNDYLIWFSKNRDHIKTRTIYERRKMPGTGSKYTTLILSDGTLVEVSKISDDEIRNYCNNGARFARVDWPLMSQDPSDRSKDFIWNDKSHPCAQGCHWRYSPDIQMSRLAIANRLNLGNKRVSGIVFWDDWPYEMRSNLWDDTGAQQDLIYVVQTSTKVVERCILMTTDPGDLVLDPTCGSGTTAYVAEQWGRRWITTDTSRVAMALARTRIMAANYPYYLLADSIDGIKKEAELSGLPSEQHQTGNDMRKGFVYKREPHVTLKSIAYNTDIKEGMSREEIDAAIARHADTETLYDQPYEDKKTVRVTGPFTVESLSPHRILSPADTDMDGTVSEEEGRKQQDFAAMILDNLRKAGVQNTKKGERLVFDRLEPFAGTWIQATGEYADADGQVRRVAVSLGPEHGTVGPQHLKEAAKEAVQGIGYDLLIVCGFAFDPHVSEEARRYGALAVLPARMNPDLAMGDELLKKTGAGNLFMIFGEPDVDITSQADGTLVARINGLDVYDPTTGEVRPSSVDDIACWFIDTQYNGESFFVRHAYFTGADQPYEKLKKALRAEIDESAWADLYRTECRPFPRPESGKIAVKVINHYGDEVLKVFEV
ncbi:site-specific DNA-methyltransferase [Desulfolutivibrio sulfoxidireducens]|uniref:site-specific DNA-methyltransferase n=1 Tax=Desulfolutivibrio sulfoxidireducens TaxID=2773299 RepID=UPI00159DD344|nr:site-specific DNA-methyltransferase [Desulfolutivibrio sulfoxidireducens]QLA14761.1 site-specific DNA-methyltransferase [Desulfolutivibrio sulfoxidireducens]